MKNLTQGVNGGMGYQPGICGPMQYRTCVARTGDWSDLTTAQVWNQNEYNFEFINRSNIVQFNLEPNKLFAYK